MLQVEGIAVGRWRLGVQSEVPIDWWNPAGDGVRDDYRAFVAALDYAKQNNVDLVLNSNKTYYLGTRLNYSFTGVIRIKSSDNTKKSVIKLSDAYLFPFQINAVQKPGTTTVTTKITPGQQSVTVANGSGFAAGDYVGFSSPLDWPLATSSEVQKGEWNIVENVAGNVLLLRYPLNDTYATGERVQVSKWTYASLEINNVEFVCNDSGNRSTVGLSLRNLQNSRVTNCIIRNFQTTGAETRACYNVEFAHNQVFGTNEIGMGYGFYPLAGFRFSVHDNTFTGGRKGVDVGGAGTLGPARETRIYRNTTYGSGKTASGTDWFNLDVVGGQNMGYAVHEGAEDVIFTDNVSYNTCYGYQLRGKNVIVRNNRVYGQCNFPFTTLAGYNHTYETNEYQAQLTPQTAPSADYNKYPRSIFFSDRAAPGHIIFRNNRADFARDFGVVLDGSRVLADVTATGNRFVFSTVDASATPFTVYWSHITKPLNRLVVNGNVATLVMTGAQSSSMRLLRDGSYQTGNLLNWETCEVEGLRADDLLTLSTKTANPQLTYSLTNLRITKQQQTARLTGKLTFTSAVKCRPFLLGMPPRMPNSSTDFRFECVTDQKHYVGRLYTNADIQFGRNESTLADAYSVATTYTLAISLDYPTK